MGTVIACEEGDDIFAFATLLPLGTRKGTAIDNVLSKLKAIVANDLDPNGETVTQISTLNL